MDSVNTGLRGRSRPRPVTLAFLKSTLADASHKPDLADESILGYK
jgi:hypothetical protein